MIVACILFLLGSNRPDHMIGKQSVRYDIYRTDRTEHCFEEIKKIGRTWMSDEIVSMREVDMEFCQ